MRFHVIVRTVFVAVLVVCSLALLGQSAFSGELRIASWNMANYPNNSVQDGDLRTILEAMGSEVILGNAKRLDILSMSETDTDSAPQTAEVFNELYDTQSYEWAYSEFDGGKDRTAFVYDSSTVSLLKTTELSRLSTDLTHNILRAEFRPAGTTGTSDFYMYSVQLKSGGGSDNETQRFEEAQIIRSDADSLVPDANIIYGGDFNWHDAKERGAMVESAWDVFTSEGNGQAFDTFDVSNVLGAGDWQDNEDFLKLHSQDPRTRVDGSFNRDFDRMDDRFDMQFVTAELFDGVGLELVEDSYRVFGNDGTHELNEPITTGEGSHDVLLALASFSDHLPVVSDFTFVVGDIDGDGVVAFGDFLILADNFGSEGEAAQGDIDGNGEIEFSDFLLLADNFGKVAAASVPEPASSLIGIVTFFGVLSFRRRCLTESA